MIGYQIRDWKDFPPLALDPYKVLGVDRSASEAEIKKAHRQKAKDLHPDQNPDDPKKLEAFKQVSQAWDILGDKEKRAKFDRGEIDGDERSVATPRFPVEQSGQVLLAGAALSLNEHGSG